MAIRYSWRQPLAIRSWPSLLESLKAIAVVVVWLLLAASVGQAILSVSGGFSLGSLVQGAVRPLFLLGLLIGLLLVDAYGLPHLIRWPAPSIWHVLGLVLVAPFFAYFAVSISHVNFTWVIIIFGTLVICLVSLFLAITRDDVSGFAVFFLTLPFLAFLEWELKQFWPTVGNWLTDSGIPLSTVFLWLFAGVTATRRLGLAKMGFVRTELDKYIIAFLAPLFVSVLYSPAPDVSYKAFLQIALSMPLFYFLLVNLVKTRRDLRWFVYALICYGLLRVFFTSYLGNTGRQVGPVLAVVEVVMPILVGLTLMSSSNWRRIAGIVALLVLLRAPLMESQTRGFVLPLAATTPIALLLYRKNRMLAVAALVCLALALVFFLDLQGLFQKFGMWTSFDALLREQPMRQDGFQAAWRMMMDHPFSGIGLRMWPEFIPLYGSKFTWTMAGTGGQTQSAYIPYSHNMYLQYGAEAGIGALVTLVLLLVVVGKKCVGLIRSLRDYENHSLAVGLLWALALYALPALSGGGFESDWYLDAGGMFWTLLGLIVCLDRVSRADYGDKTA